MTTLSERISALRREKNEPQTSLADALGISNRTVSKWENGESEPDIFRCVLWIFGHEAKPIEASLLVKRAGADPARTDEILKKLVKIGAIALETYVINGRERVIADVAPALWIKFKGPMLTFLSAVHVLTSCGDGHRTFGNNSDPPFLK